MSDTYIIHNDRKTLLEVPAVMPKISKGTELEKAAVLDGNGVILEHPVFMAQGITLEEGHPAVKLLPGENTVDANYWDKVCQVHGVKLFLACGYLKNLGEGEATQLIAQLDTLPPDMARARILECTNVTVLQGWADHTENRVLHGHIAERKAHLIATASGAPIRGGQIRDQRPEDRSFGDKTTSADAEGDGTPAFGHGEETHHANPAPAPVAPPPSPEPVLQPPAPSPPAPQAAAPAPAPAPPEGGEG